MATVEDYMRPVADEGGLVFKIISAIIVEHGLSAKGCL